MKEMLALFSTNLLILLHFSFILFVVCGGLLVMRWRKLIWLHLPAAAWGAWIEFSGWICPLTPLENYFRQQAGEPGYSAGFIEKYLLPIIYPVELTRELQFLIGFSVIIINLLIYAILYHRNQKKTGTTP